MAIYHCCVKPIRRSAGRSATAAAAYRAADRIEDTRTGACHDYARRGGVLSAEIITPENAPEWARERMRLWNGAEAAEKRKDACVAREIEVSLPHELGQDARADLARGFALELAGRYGVAVDMALHAPHAKGDQRNHHVHFLLTTRALEEDGFARGKSDLELSDADRKKRGLPSRTQELKDIRERWAGHVNQALERGGHEVRVDHRSYEERGIEKAATQHMGPSATKIEREGKPSRIGTRNRQVRIWNRDAHEARQQMAIVDAAIREERARLAAEQERKKAKGRTERAGGGRAPAPPRKVPPAPQRTPEPVQVQPSGLRGRISEWANGLRAQRQSAQIDRRREIEGTQDRERFALDGKLDAFYGPAVEKVKGELEQVKDKLQGRLSRRAREEAERQAEALRKTLDSAQQRQDEQRGALAQRHKEDMERLRAREKAQREADEARIARGPADSAPPVNDNRGAQASPEDERAAKIEAFKARMRERRGQDRGKDRGGRDYER